MERPGMDDVVCDVLVVGSGASGFATALTARHLGLDVLIAEKETMFGGMMVGSEDLPHLYNVTRSPWSMLHAAKMVARHARDKLSYSRGTRLTNGNALIASLATSALEKGIPIWLSANVRQLTTKD